MEAVVDILLDGEEHLTIREALLSWGMLESTPFGEDNSFMQKAQDIAKHSRTNNRRYTEDQVLFGEVLLREMEEVCVGLLKASTQGPMQQAALGKVPIFRDPESFFELLAETRQSQLRIIRAALVVSGNALGLIYRAGNLR